MGTSPNGTIEPGVVLDANRKVIDFSKSFRVVWLSTTEILAGDIMLDLVDFHKEIPIKYFYPPWRNPYRNHRNPWMLPDFQWIPVCFLSNPGAEKGPQKGSPGRAPEIQRLFEIWFFKIFNELL